jgi:putative heme iron utilization protein
MFKKKGFTEVIRFLNTKPSACIEAVLEECNKTYCLAIQNHLPAELAQNLKRNHPQDDVDTHLPAGLAQDLKENQPQNVDILIKIRDSL